MGRFDSRQKAAILESAVGVFAERGLRGATTRLLGRKAKVNSALIYYYFENKHTLFKEAIRMVVRGFLEHLHRRRHVFRGPRDRLAYLVEGMFSYYTLHPDRMQLMILAFSQHPDLLGQVISSVLQEGSIIPLDVLAEGMQRGELRPMHPVHAWWSILGLCLFSLNIRGILSQVQRSKVPMPAFDLKERERQIMDLLVNGLATSDDSKNRKQRSRAR